MKTLVIVAHPKIDDSTTQQFLKQGVEQVDAKWHHLDSLKTFDKNKERQLLLRADRIIFQFPLYWYSAPASLKRWEDEVLSSNFVYGDGQYNLADKEFGLVVTTGMPDHSFKTGEAENFSLDEILTPYRALAMRAHMKILPLFAINQFYYMEETAQMQLLMDYERYLTQPYPDSLKKRSQWYFAQFNNYKFKNNVDVLKSAFEQSNLDLDELHSTLKMIKQGEDDSLE